MAEVIIEIEQIKEVVIDMTAVTGEESLQNLWTVKSDADKNTFVDANTFSILKFIFSDAAATTLDMFTALVTAEVLAIGAYVDSQDAAGQWSTRDSFANFKLQTEANSLIDWIRGVSMTAVNGPTHIPGTGFDFNGVDQYINSLFNPSTDGIKYTLNDFITSVFCVAATPTAAFNTLWGNNIGTPSNLLNDNNLATKIEFIANSDGTLIVNIAERLSSNNLYTGVRTASNLAKIYKNGIEIASANQISTGVPNGNIGINGRLASQFLEGTTSSFMTGAAIGFDHLNDYNNLVCLNLALSQI